MNALSALELPLLAIGLIVQSLNLTFYFSSSLLLAKGQFTLWHESDTATDLVWAKIPIRPMPRGISQCAFLLNLFLFLLTLSQSRTAFLCFIRTCKDCFTYNNRKAIVPDCCYQQLVSQLYCFSSRALVAYREYFLNKKIKQNFEIRFPQKEDK